MKSFLKTVFTNVLGWIIIPALVIYGYYYGNDASVSIIVFYMWLIFILQIVIFVLLATMLYIMDDVKLNEDTMKDKKKVDGILKWHKKLGSGFYKFTVTAASVLYTGLSILIAASGAIWTAFLFIITFVVIKYFMTEMVKEIYVKIIPKVEKAAEDLRVKEILDMVGKGEDK